MYLRELEDKQQINAQHKACVVPTAKATKYINNT